MHQGVDRAPISQFARRDRGTRGEQMGESGVGSPRQYGDRLDDHRTRGSGTPRFERVGQREHEGDRRLAVPRDQRQLGPHERRQPGVLRDELPDIDRHEKKTVPERRHAKRMQPPQFAFKVAQIERPDVDSLPIRPLRDGRGSGPIRVDSLLERGEVRGEN